MNTIATIAGLAVAATAMTASASIVDLLCIDLSVQNMITITATDGLSASTMSGDEGVGFMMVDFFTFAGTGISEDGTGNLSSAANVSDGSPKLYNSGTTPSGGSFGLNVWSFANAMNFTAGEVAFSGSSTWTLNADDYAAALAGNTSGDIYASADTDDDLPNAIFLGNWKVVPAPSSAALLGLGGMLVGRRRR